MIFSKILLIRSFKKCKRYCCFFHERCCFLVEVFNDILKKFTN
jgi:hypothetical protein